MNFMEDDYCPIKTKEGKCKIGEECNYILCWEKMHYYQAPKFFEEKMLKWIHNKRGDESRWKNK